MQKNHNNVKFGISIDSLLKTQKHVKTKFKDKYNQEAKDVKTQKEKKTLKNELLKQQNEIIQKKLGKIIKKK